MRRHFGQAARAAGGALHTVLSLVVGAAVIAVIAVAALSWRLAQGPLELPFVVDRFDALASAATGGADVSISKAELVWHGFQSGFAAPLEIRISDVAWRDAQGQRIAEVPQVEVSLSVAALLRGRILPRSVSIVGPRLRVWRAADGGISADAGTADTPPEPTSTGFAGSIAATLADFARPRGTRGTPLDELARLSIRDAALTVVDRGMDTVWNLPHATIELDRGEAGGLSGGATFEVLLAGNAIRGAMSVALPAGGDHLHITASLPPIRPAAIAAAVPKLAMLDAADLPVSLTLTGDVDTALRHPTAQLGIELGAGGVKIARGVMPIVEGAATLSGTLADLTLAVDHLDLAPTPDGPRTRITALAHARQLGEQIAASLALTLDHVEAADLPALWPEGLGGPGTRPWMVENVTGGTLSDARVALELTMPKDLSDAELTHVEGGLDGHGMTIHWLRPVPPAEAADGHLTLLTPDSLVISVTSGQQTRSGKEPAVLVKGGTVTLTGLATTSQFADIDLQMAGPVPELLNVLRHPRLKLFDKRPLPIKESAGQFSGELNVDHLPLKNDLDVDDVHIRTKMKLTALRLVGAIAGRDLDGGTFDLAAGNDGLHASGAGSIAGLPATLTLDQDFRGGPPSQVIQRAVLATTVAAERLADFGLAAGDGITGQIGVRADVSQRRNNRGEASLHADLGAAGLAIPQLSWRRAAGTPATLDAHVLLSGERVTGVDQFRLAGEGVNVSATVDFADGRPTVVHVARLALGRAIDAHGEIGVPADAEHPWRVTLQGPLLDVSGPLTRNGETPGPKQRGPLWTADLRFEKVTTANATALYGLAVRGENDGWINRNLRAIGRTRTDTGNFTVSITHDGKTRSLTASADDAGSLLRALDITSDMRAGQMSLKGTYDDTRPDHRLSGTAEINDFAIRNGAGFGKLLQAFSVYGLIDVIRTPDLAFNALTVPFRLGDDTLEITDARAFNSSLGMTVKGRADLAGRRVDLQGTIVPAYLLNSLIGRLPIIGQLVIPEKGGGLIAAGWSMRGTFDDPDIGVNPLAAITPGFLRGLFGIFDGKSSIDLPGEPKSPPPTPAAPQGPKPDSPHN